MAAKVKIKWKKNALYELRSSTKVVNHLKGIGRDVLAEAKSSAKDEGAEYAEGSKQGAKKPQGRWRVSVVTTNGEAVREEGRHNTLQKALTSQGKGGETNRGQ